MNRRHFQFHLALVLLSFKNMNSSLKGNMWSAIPLDRRTKRAVESRSTQLNINIHDLFHLKLKESMDSGRLEKAYSCQSAAVKNKII